MSSAAKIRGPILSVSNIGEHEPFFTGPLALRETARACFGPEETVATFGVSGVSVETVFFQRIPTDFGVRLLQFDPLHQSTIRQPDRGTDRDALKVVDFYAPNFERALLQLRVAGHEPKSDIADYHLPEGRFREAHYWRPDNIVCAVISGPADFFSGFVSTKDNNFSEPQSISAPVTDVEAVTDFYHDVFGLKPLHRYEISNPSFDALVGADQPLKLSAVNVGSHLREPYLGVIDYGQARGAGKSLAGQSRPPVRGLTGVEVQVQDIDIVASAALKVSAPVLAGPTTIEYPPLGEVGSCVIEGPHGVIHHVIEK